MTELWDAYDVNFNKLEDITLVRGEKIPSDVFHLVCEIAVKHQDGQYLLMQRDFNKHRGGMWELTAGGAAQKGEKPIDCAIRELKEETGIFCEELTEIGRVVHKGQHTIYIEYLCVTNCNKDCVTLQRGETENYKWVSVDGLEKVSNLITRRIQLFLKDFSVKKDG